MTRRAVPVLVLAALGALLAALTAGGTHAYWSDEATVQAGSFTSGTLDLRLDGNQGNPTAWAHTAFALAGMVPGESVATGFPVQNAGTIPLTYTVTGTASGGLAPYLTFEAFVGGTASNATTGGLRSGTCTGTSMGALTLTATAQPVVGQPQALAAQASQPVCLLARLAATAPNSAQGQSGSAELVFAAQQVGAP